MWVMNIVVLEPASEQLEDGDSIRQRRDMNVAALQCLHGNRPIDTELMRWVPPPLELDSVSYAMTVL